jgi:transcriptional regulator with XRE-family HTH domain
MEYGEYLFKLRKEKSLSQEDVANELNVSRQSVSLWETNQSSPSMENMISLAKLYQVSLDELVGIKEIKSKKKMHKYTSSYKVDKTVIYRRDYYYIFSKKDALLVFITLFFFIFALLCFIGASELSREAARTILILGFVSIVLGYLFYPLKVVKNLIKQSNNDNVVINFHNDHIEILRDSHEDVIVQYIEIDYYIAKKDFAILVEKNRGRIYVQMQRLLETDMFLKSKIERRTKPRAFWK